MLLDIYAKDTRDSGYMGGGKLFEYLINLFPTKNVKIC